MNCEPKDMAIVVRDTYGLSCTGRMIGTPVTVDSSFTTEFFGRAAWRLRTGVTCPGCGNVLLAMYDADLQPIRGQSRGVSSDTRIDRPEEVTA